MYTTAAESILYNQELMKPYITVKELLPKLWKIPQEYYKNRYICVIHGVGMMDEFPAISDQYDPEADHKWVF